MVVNCPACGQPLRAPDEMAGALVRCVSCGREFTTPAVGATAVVPTPGPVAPPPVPGPVPLPSSYTPRISTEGTHAKRTSAMAVTSLILGIVSIVCPCVPALLGLVALLLGIAGFVVIGGRPNLTGRGHAVGGIVTGVVGLILSLVMWGLFLWPTVQMTLCLVHMQQTALRIQSHYDVPISGDPDLPQAGGDEFVDALVRDCGLTEADVTCPIHGRRYVGPAIPPGGAFDPSTPLLICPHHSVFGQHLYVGFRMNLQQVTTGPGQPDYEVLRQQIEQTPAAPAPAPEPPVPVPEPATP